MCEWEKTEQEWRELLTPSQFRVLRKHGTEAAGSSELNHVSDYGSFICAGCKQLLFRTEAKYESGTGWPSFYQPAAPDVVGTKTDRKFFMKRTEVHCSRCKGHLGHVFSDGPQPTGLRYCMNGDAMQFSPDPE